MLLPHETSRVKHLPAEQPQLHCGLRLQACNAAPQAGHLPAPRGLPAEGQGEAQQARSELP